jgi:hypothetical protein
MSELASILNPKTTNDSPRIRQPYARYSLAFQVPDKRVFQRDFGSIDHYGLAATSIEVCVAKAKA